jgi:hypothetical protein
MAAPLVSAPIAATTSMPFLPGYGYGIAAAAGPALQYANSLDLQKRQMAINEAAQKSTDKYYGAIENAMDFDMNVKKYTAEGNARAGELGYSDVDPLTGEQASPTTSVVPGGSAPAPPPGAPRYGAGTPPNGAVSTASAKPPSGPVTAPLAAQIAGANALGKAPDEADAIKAAGASGDPMAVDMVAGLSPADKGNPTGLPDVAGAPKVASGGPSAKPVVPHTLYGHGKESTTSNLPMDKPALSQTMNTGTGAASASAQQNLMAQGKIAPGPQDGAGYFDQAEKLDGRADAVEQRLKESLRAIETAHAGDGTYVPFAKSALMAKIQPQIAAMRGNADQLRNLGSVANHAADGSTLGFRILGQIANGGAINGEDFKQQNKDVLDRLGVHESDLHLFDGMHKSGGAPIKGRPETRFDSPLNAGWIVNEGGYMIPYDVVGKMANFSLPYGERMSAMKDMTSLVEHQWTAASRLREIGTKDPLRMMKAAADLLADGVGKQNDLSQSYTTAQNTLIWGGDIKVPDKSSKDGFKVVHVNPIKPTDAEKSLPWDQVVEKRMNDYLRSYNDPNNADLTSDMKAVVKLREDSKRGLNVATSIVGLAKHFSTNGVNVSDSNDQNQRDTERTDAVARDKRISDLQKIKKLSPEQESELRLLKSQQK